MGEIHETTSRAVWSFLRRTRHRVVSQIRENPLREPILGPVVEALASAEAALIEQDPDLPLRRGRGPRLVAAEEATGTAALRARVAELEKAVRAREDHIAIVAHDLRGPLSPVLLLVRRLLDDLDPGPLHTRVAAISDRLEQLVGKLNRLLDATRLQTDDLALDPEPLDLRDVVSALIAELTAEIHSSPTIELIGLESLTGRWDRTRLEEIVRNLLGNAMRFGAQQPITVELRLGGDGKHAVLAVRDRGCGIRTEDQARIFDKHVRLGRGSGGFGLGLWIVKQLVTAMGGMVTVRSSLGEGSEFTVTLPRNQR